MENQPTLERYLSRYVACTTGAAHSCEIMLNFHLLHSSMVWGIVNGREYNGVLPFATSSLHQTLQIIFGPHLKQQFNNQIRLEAARDCFTFV